jgi:hypothetical protein
MNQVKIGDITIKIPPERKIDFTGLRAQVKYDVPGDRPRYQDMGREERTVTFNGIFVGKDAYKNALALQTYYDSGKNIDTGTQKAGFLFLFEDISCRVLIKNYAYQYYRADKVRYDIELVRLESDFDKKETKKEKKDKVAKAKSALDKLKDAINKAMKVVNDVSAAAQKVNDEIFKARKAYMDVTRMIKTPIANLRQQMDDLKWQFDRTLDIANRSVGRTSTPKNREELQQSLTAMQKSIPLAQALILLAEQSSLGERLDEIIETMQLRTVQQGDNLRIIATEVFGSPHEWVILAQINRLPTSVIPPEVKVIRIPDASNIGTVEKLLDERITQLPKAAAGYIPVNLR